MKRLVLELDRLFGVAERRIALLERCRPLNLASEQRRLQRELESGRIRAPEFEYAAAADLGELRRALARSVEALEGSSWLGRLYRERALELWIEAGIAEHVGRPSFAREARARFDDVPRGGRTAKLARSWALEEPEAGGVLVRSDDRSDPRSLVSQLMAEIGRARLPVRVAMRAELYSLAATADGAIYVRAGARLTEVDARRIAVHEVRGHASPREAARRAPFGIFAVATRGGGDAEEGRALLLERRCDLMSRGRRRELGLRHLAARAVCAGASFCEVLELLREFELEPQQAVAIAIRVQRGGGLAREIVYLPKLLELEAAFAAEPGLERWLELGRLSLGAARQFAAHGARAADLVQATPAL